MLYFFQKIQGVIASIMDRVIYLLILFTTICGSYRKFPEPFKGNLATPLGVRRSTSSYVEPYYVATYPKLSTGTIISHCFNKVMIQISLHQKFPDSIVIYSNLILEEKQDLPMCQFLREARDCMVDVATSSCPKTCKMFLQGTFLYFHSIQK